MPNELTIRIAGEAGQGMQTVGMALCKIFSKASFNIFANQDYMSRIRGGNNFFQIRISDRLLYTLRENVDITVALDKNSVDVHKKDLNKEGVLVLDKKKFNISENNRLFFDVPMYEMAKNTGGSDIFINSVACGVLAGIMNIEFDFVYDVLRQIFSNKEEDVIEKNINAADAGYRFVKDNFNKAIFDIKRAKAKKTLLINGNEAIALGAIKAGCKFYSAYPMTPSTSIMNFIAHYADDFNIVIEQAEDEIAAINMTIGASFAGVRAMTATSGGGFALMTEGLSLAGMTETPVVVVDAQRPAPATGFPTRTEQSDLEFLLHAGHGEFSRVVFTPGTIEEAFYAAIKAFDVSEKFQIPVLIMTDQHLADSYRNIDLFDLSKVKVQRHIISKKDSKNITDYKRYQLTPSGISPRALPSWIDDVIYVDSDEHTEEGHITEDGVIRIKMMQKRFYKKMQALSKEIQRPTSSNIKGADVVLIGYGSTYGVLKEASEMPGKKIGFIHFSQVWPFPEKDIISLLEGSKKNITVENNAGAQLARLIRRETGIKADRSILRFDGRPFNLDFLMREI